MAQADKENEQPKTGEESEQGQWWCVLINITIYVCMYVYKLIIIIFSGSFTFKLNSRKHTIELTARTEDVGIKWVNAIQEVRKFLFTCCTMLICMMHTTGD